MLIIGHRGAKGLAPENSLAALEAALKARSAMIHIDVRVSADGIPLLWSNPKIQSTEGRSLAITKTEFIQLQQARPDLLTLEAALQFVDRRADMIIELKPGTPTDPIIATIEPRLVKNWVESDIIVTSHDYKLLKQIKIKAPQIMLAVSDKWSGVRASRRAKKLGTARLIMDKRWLWGGFIKSISRHEYKLSAYTINNPRQAAKWEKHGLYAVITDYPDRFI